MTQLSNLKGMTMATASARHILVNNEALCKELKEKINAGEITFEEAAKQNSLCPSGARGGELGRFGQGQMVPEFDRVVFNDEVGVVHGPVKTQFGYHLLEITERS
jgi:peptidyl-prolyl cis-trans isomerase C